MLETANLAKKPHTKRDNRRKKTHTKILENDELQTTGSTSFFFFFLFIRTSTKS